MKSFYSNRQSQFESLVWGSNEEQCGAEAETPAITPGFLSGPHGNADDDGNMCQGGIQYGIHWNQHSYPAWTGKQFTNSNNAHQTYRYHPTPNKNQNQNQHQHQHQHQQTTQFSRGDSEGDEELGTATAAQIIARTPPFTITHIAQMTDQITDVFGFQPDVAVNVFELLMSQLDSRSARSNPRRALRSLHSEYISGIQANYRRWYFAAEMDLIDLSANEQCEPEQEYPPKNTPFNEEEYYLENTLEEVEFAWDQHYHSVSDEQMLSEVLIYLLCWTEANQLRFMPECMAFIVKCCLDYYRAYFMPYPQYSRDTKDLPRFFFLEKIVNPLYNTYCHLNFVKLESGQSLRRREGDHKNIIGYDDINQLFWYKLGLERIKVKNPYFDCNDPNTKLLNKNCESMPLIKLPAHQRLLQLQNVEWQTVFKKTYRESRSWLHSLTNFSRIWILHSSVFWFYTAYHVPSLYSPESTYDNPIPPKDFVKWTIMSFGGAFGPLLTLLGLIGELRFVPRNFPGAKPILPRITLISIMLLILLVPGICNLTFNSWTSDDSDLMPATVTGGVLFGIAIIYSLYLSFQPLDSVHGYNLQGSIMEEPTRKKRRYLASHIFTGCFSQRDFNDALLSWLLCVLVFVAKFTESYFFLTLSVRDPIYELRIMDLSQNCIGDRAFFGKALCNVYTKILLVGIVFTDMVLFFLDTYLWYVILNTVISVSISFKSGTSVWTPWRNIYSCLAKRISTKLLTPGSRGARHNSPSQRLHALRVVWNSIIESMLYSHIINREQAVRLTYMNESTHEPAFFTMEEDSNTLCQTRGSSNAYRRISFFAQSLSTPMKTAIPVSDMPSFTVLIPHYKETMILGLSESIKANMGAKVTILEYLQKLYPAEWDNFVQHNHMRLNADLSDVLSDWKSHKSSRGSITQSLSTNESSMHFSDATLSQKIAVQKVGFSSLDPNDTVRTRLWCSERTQTLFRTLKGFSNYSAALRVLYYAEELDEEVSEDFYRFQEEQRRQFHEEAQLLCNRKFKLLVAMQLYSSYTPDELREVEIMLHAVPELTIAYIEYEEYTGRYYSCHIDNTCPVLENGRRQPRLRIRLSGNPILGDGKADNQNSALPFYRGEYIQLVDANQDNYLEECLKIRNLLMEFEPNTHEYSPLTSTTASATTTSASVSVLASPASSSKSSSECSSSIGSLTSPSAALPSTHRRLTDVESGLSNIFTKSILNPGPAPVAIVGAREYIFSENIGVLGDVAAGKEQTFGTLFSRTLAKVGAKLHYGHPDFLNAIFMTTRGGVSKAQGGLHLNEDIYAGMTAMIRGGRIKHSEYYQCGKGRDLGFVSILNFTVKIGAGMGEQILSREYFYMGTQLPFDRFITFYYAHPGFHLNNAFIMLSLEMLMMVILWISSIGAVNTDCMAVKSITSADRRTTGCVNVSPLINWVQRCVISIFLVFFVSLCPLFFQEFTERGIVRSVVRILKHFCSLSMLFEVFTCRIYARSFWEDMNIGGAKYLATGRGLAISRLAFSKLYSSYNPEIVSGCKAALILVFACTVKWSNGYLWFWSTTASLCLCPFLYNPHQFAFTEFFVDYYELLRWFWRARIIEEEKQETWSNFTRETREKITGVKSQFSKSATKPSLRNAIVSKLGSAVLCCLLIGVPYIYIGGQKISRYQDSPSDTSVLILLLGVAAAPCVASAAASLGAFVFAIVLHALGSRRHSNAIAFVTHTFVLLALLSAWWLIYIVSAYNFTMWILGIATVCCVHHLWHTLLTILIVRRQRNFHKTNNPWWQGDWRSAKVGYKLPLVVLEELIVKHVENVQFAYDFLICHFILAVQSPLVFIPCVDKLHTLFLMWLRPSVTEAAARASSFRRERRLNVIGRLACGLFVVQVGVLAMFTAFPLYARREWLLAAESVIARLVR